MVWHRARTGRRRGLSEDVVVATRADTSQEAGSLLVRSAALVEETLSRGDHWVNLGTSN